MREEERGTAETARNTEASGKKTRGLGKWDGLGRGAKLLGDFASYLISPEILPYSTAFPLTRAVTLDPLPPHPSRQAAVSLPFGSFSFLILLRSLSPKDSADFYRAMSSLLTSELCTGRASVSAVLLFSFNAPSEFSRILRDRASGKSRAHKLIIVFLSMRD